VDGTSAGRWEVMVARRSDQGVGGVSCSASFDDEEHMPVFSKQR
jgi:hypothetical protein